MLLIITAILTGLFTGFYSASLCRAVADVNVVKSKQLLAFSVAVIVWPVTVFSLLFWYAEDMRLTMLIWHILSYMAAFMFALIMLPDD